MKQFLTSFIFVLLFSQTQLFAQQTQSVRGRVIDKVTQQPLPGANVVLLNTNPVIGVATDINGWFKIPNVPVGRVSVDISFLGYQNATMNNMELTAGKELLVQVELDEKVQAVSEVVVKANRSKTQPINDMAVISARSFSVDETEKYAGSRGDIARMASNFAGVSFANDSRNDIIIRGNSPSGLLWKLEDVDIPNPNHYAENGTTGGPVGMLNNNVLRNSDFFTGAFPAEYGNALSGVFDLKMRAGNNEKYEHMYQIGFNGFELGSEGPISKNKKSSYLINYRYSTMAFMEKIGVNFGTSGTPFYQDLSYKLNFPTKKGLVTVFGLGGLSSIDMLDSKQTEEDMYSNGGQDLYNRSKMGTSGISYTHYVTSKTYAKLVVSGLYQNGGTDVDTLDINKAKTRVLNHNISEYRLSVTAMAGTKFSAALSSKVGLTVDQMGYDMSTFSFDRDSNRLTRSLLSTKNLGEGGYMLRSFVEFNYKLSDQLVFTPGVQFLHYTLSKKSSFEPRLGLSWSYAPNRKINVGYGKHAKSHALSTYFLGSYVNNEFVETNKKLDFIKSDQFIIGHDWNITENMRIKVEAYYQNIYNVPIEQRPTYFSLLNTGDGWGVGAEDSLVNKGTGKNYGLEITVEKFLSHGYYYLLTASLFESKYKGSDGIERNTAFNGNFVINGLVGKEFKIKNNLALLLDLKVAYAGGKRKIPIDVAKSIKTTDTEYILKDAYKTQYPNYLKADFKVTLKYNMGKTTHDFQVYIENITNHKNVLGESYDRTKGKVIENTQLGFFPMVQYRFTF